MDQKEFIRSQVAEIVRELAPEYSGEIGVEIPNQKAHGDYSVTVAMQLTRVLKKPPMVIAQMIVDRLGNPKEFREIAAVAPGFINFFVQEELIFADILTAALRKDFYPAPSEREKVIIEHTSVNPNKAMHVGHLRNAVLGDVLARVYRKLGYDVEVQNYIDNTGLQVADTTNGIRHLDLKPAEDQAFDDYCWDIYTEINKRYETDEALVREREKISHAIEEGNNEIATQAREIVDKIVDCHLELMARLSIGYDLLVYESDIIDFGFWEQAFTQLKESPNFYLETEGEQAGCWVLKYDSPKYGNKIFVRSNGTKVYTAKDTAYQLWKFGALAKDFTYGVWPKTFLGAQVYTTDLGGDPSDRFGKGDVVINVIDERQTYPQEMVKYALRSLGYTKEYEHYDHLAYGVVSLSPNTAERLGIDTSEGKAAYSMSGRKGIGVKVTDLLRLMIANVKESRADVVPAPQGETGAIASPDEIAIGALKHYMLKYNPLSEIIFDYEEALRLTGNTGPYLQYSLVRARSILAKADSVQLTVDLSEVSSNESEGDLIKLISQWPSVLRETSQSHAVSAIAEYAFQLSSAFHSFYEKNSVLKSEPATQQFRLVLVQAYINVITEVLDVLGIAAPERM